MNKEAVRQLLSTLAVVVSLIFVAVEIRQNTTVVRGAAIQSITELQLSATLMGLELPELRDAWDRAATGRMDELTDEDQQVLRWFYAAQLRIAENRFRQFQLGLIDQDALSQVGGSSITFRNPYFRVYWALRSHVYDADFSRHVEDTMLPQVQDSVRTRIDPSG